jgi:hypothetical protein
MEPHGQSPWYLYEIPSYPPFDKGRYIILCAGRRSGAQAWESNRKR